MTTSFNINGVPYKVNLITLPPDITLNTFIREHAQLKATKFMCLEGGCGACVCVIKGKHPASGEERVWATNSCLTLLNTCKDWQIITCEGIGNSRDGYHPLQKRLAKLNGTQCGFCSPGFVMNMYGLLESQGNSVSMEEVENAFGGNLCRCTGYRPILDAFKSFAVDSNIQVPAECLDIEDLSKKICPKTGNACVGSCRKPFNYLIYEDGSKWYWPQTLAELFTALEQLGNDEFMLVAGNTAHGVYRRSPDIKHFIDVHAIPELKKHQLGTEKLSLGGNLSLAEAMDIFLQAANQSGFEYCNQLWHHFDLIANVPVRNTGTLAGNIAIKKTHPDFPSDVFICFEALDVQLVVNENATTMKTVSLTDYLASTNSKAIISAFELKAYPKNKYLFDSFKTMPRAQNAHAYVNAAFLIDLDPATTNVNSARICFGGINPDFKHASDVEDLLKGQNLYDKDVVNKAITKLTSLLDPDEVLPDASPEYRIKLACGLFYKFLLKSAPAEKVKEEFKSGGAILKRPLSSGTQTFETNEKNYPVTQAVQKVEGFIQCTGEATYMNDTLTTSNTVYCAFVNATKVGATIESIDASEALRMPGVVAFYSAKDIPGENTFCATSFGFAIEEIFCAGKVLYYDQPLGVIAAITRDTAHRATSKVKVVYAKAAEVVLPNTASVLEANVKERIKHIIRSDRNVLEFSDKPDITAQGTFEIGEQYHFTMEPHTTVVIPFEEGLQVYTTTQWMDHTQCVLAQMLQIKMKDVQLKVLRLGGGYGAKITRSNQVSCAAALVAYKLNRPVRFVQTIESMMGSCGKRWGCLSEYEFHAKANGKIVGLKNNFFEDAGCSLNDNPLKGHTLLFSKNCYDLTEENFKFDGQAVLTDAPSATWCRAPGSVEAIAMIENIIEHIAFESKMDPADVRLANIKPGNKLLQLLPQFLESTEYRERRKEIDAYNEKNRWRKRGLGLTIMDYSLVYLGRHTQYPATVAIYHEDGTVVITHGGIEMGQGINTKVAQVAAHVLSIPLELVKVEASDTINGANSLVTGGSVGSESVCMAVRKACDKLNERLKPIRESLQQNATWQEIVESAYDQMVNLIVIDDYKIGDLEPYAIYGLALTEIEVDIITGSNQIRRADILQDTGESLSPYIDIGQIEGSFVMLLGYWLTEHLVYDRQTGQLMTNRSWNYKVPGAKDIPIDFRIELLQNSPNPAGFMRSKATGEPASCLAVSVIFAVQYALQSARKDAGIKREYVRLGTATTPEVIVLNAGHDPKLFSLE